MFFKIFNYYLYIIFIVANLACGVSCAQEKFISSNYNFVNSSNLKLKSKQAVILDFLTKQVLFEKKSHEIMTPSSMTKVLTSYLIEEKIYNGDTSLESKYLVSKQAWNMPGTRSFFALGSIVTLSDILNGIIVQSGNDACIVAAEGLYGDEKQMVIAMNNKAKELGMYNSNFVNSTGLPDKNHYSTAYDLAILGIELIKNHKEFYHLYSKKVFACGKGLHNKPIRQWNRNPLLYKNVNCDGIKTGATLDGGYGLMASFIQNDRRYVMVINGLDSKQNRADDAMVLVNWVSNNFHTRTLCMKNDEVGVASIWLGNKKTKILAGQDLQILLPSNVNEDEIIVDMRLKKDIKAPVYINDELGKIIVSYNNYTYDIPVIAGENVNKLPLYKQIMIYIMYFLGFYKFP